MSSPNPPRLVSHSTDVPHTIPRDLQQVMKRHANCHAYVNAACLFPLDNTNTVIKEPRLVFGGLTPKTFFASQTAEVCRPTDAASWRTLSRKKNRPLQAHAFNIFHPLSTWLARGWTRQKQSRQLLPSSSRRYAAGCPLAFANALPESTRFLTDMRMSADHPRPATSGGQHRISPVSVDNAAVQKHPRSLAVH
jgi:hypothetical protein